MNMRGDHEMSTQQTGFDRSPEARERHLRDSPECHYRDDRGWHGEPATKASRPVCARPGRRRVPSCGDDLDYAWYVELAEESGRSVSDCMVSACTEHRDYLGRSGSRDGRAGEAEGGDARRPDPHRRRSGIAAISISDENNGGDGSCEVWGVDHHVIYRATEDWIKGQSEPAYRQFDPENVDLEQLESVVHVLVQRAFCAGAGPHEQSRAARS